MMSGFDVLYITTGWAVFVGASGAFFSFGVIAVCRWMEWAPVNVNVTINNPAGTRSVVSPGAADE